MIIAFWIIGGVTALAFIAAGVMKATRPKAALAGSMAWVEDYSGGAVKAIGVVEIRGALGIILPALTGIAAVLSPIAAIGLVLVMITAAVVHVRRHESPVAPIVLAIFAVVTAIIGFVALL